MTVVLVFLVSLAVVFFFSVNKANSEQKVHIQNSGGILIKYDAFIKVLYEFGTHYKIYPVNQTTFVAHYWGGGLDKKAILHVQYVFGKTIVAWFYPLANGGTDKTVREFEEGADQVLMAKWAISEYADFIKRRQLSE